MEKNVNNVVLKKEKKSFKEKFFKPIPKKHKDLFMKIGLISFVCISIIFSYLLHWACGLLVTLNLFMVFYFLFCPVKADENKKSNKIDIVNVKRRCYNGRKKNKK